MGEILRERKSTLRATGISAHLFENLTLLEDEAPPKPLRRRWRDGNCQPDGTGFQPRASSA